MFDYVEDMRQLTVEGFDRLHANVREVVFSDFPDYDNVGDSAIALGQISYWRNRGIAVLAAYDALLSPMAIFDSSAPVVINGGGNLGGLYPHLDAHRFAMAQSLRQETLLIQEPQSVHFLREENRRAFLERMADRKELRVGVRDAKSFALLRDEVSNLFLVPDGVHLLGNIQAPQPSRPALFLRRRDEEADSEFEGGIDWPRDPLDLRLQVWLKWRSQQVSLLKPVLRRPVATMTSRANRRLAAGVGKLAPAQLVVTDRLHAMLIALQMGRRVIAIDNKTQKLTNYAQTWLTDATIPLEFCESWGEAMVKVSRQHGRPNAPGNNRTT